MTMKIEELAAKAGLRIGTFFVTGGYLYRVERFTKLRIYLLKQRTERVTSLPVDANGVGVSGNQENYIEVAEYSLKTEEYQQRWIANIGARVVILPDTDEDVVIRRVNAAADIAAPITAEIDAENARHTAFMKDARERRLAAVTNELTKPLAE